MFNQNLYSALLQAAHTILQNHMNQLGTQFCQGFMFDHDISNGPNSERFAKQLFDFAARETQRITGTSTIPNDDFLFKLVGEYIKNIHNQWMQQQNRGGFGNQSSFGGFGRQQSTGFGSGGFGSSSGSFGFGSKRPDAGSHLHESASPSPAKQAPSMDFGQTAPSQQSAPIAVVPHAHNPLDEAGSDETIVFTPVEEPLTWGYDNPKDYSIVISQRDTLKTRENKYPITQCDSWSRIYFNTTNDVAEAFFNTAPDSFLAQNFIVRVNYNHIEDLDVPTDIFLSTAKTLTEELTNPRNLSIGNTVLTILNNMYHGHRVTIADYLVKRINRALQQSFGISSDPALRIRFQTIEDIEELLGTNFQSKLIDEPNARGTVITIIKTAILNALGGYSEVMFGDHMAESLYAMKYSPIFPESLFGVYISKTMIPEDATSENYSDFIKALQDVVLKKKTYVRQIRSVIVTNILGGQILGKIQDVPTVVRGSIPALLSQFILHHERPNIDVTAIKAFQDIKMTMGYKTYLEDPMKAESILSSLYENRDKVSIPVDQVLYAIQYKQSPNAYIKAMDICTVMNNRDINTQVILCDCNPETLD